MKPRILILHATGTNRDREAARACELAGGKAEIMHVNQLAAGERSLLAYQMLVLPGGFSYGDDLGAGKMWAIALRHRLGDQLLAFIESGRPVMGICNGFQALVKAGLLPRMDPPGATRDPAAGAQAVAVSRQATLARNDSARFECRWVYLQPEAASPCIFTRGLTQRIYCPVAHGEGKFVAENERTLSRIEAQSLVSLRYVNNLGQADGYPWNPNGSQARIAGVCSPSGTVFGLMPHPEDHVVPVQHPRVHRHEQGLLGLPLFQNGVRYAAGM